MRQRSSAEEGEDGSPRDSTPELTYSPRGCLQTFKAQDYFDEPRMTAISEAPSSLRLSVLKFSSVLKFGIDKFGRPIYCTCKNTP